MTEVVLILKPRVWRAVFMDIVVFGVAYGGAYVWLHIGDMMRGGGPMVVDILTVGVWRTVGGLVMGLLFALGFAETRRRIGTIVVTNMDIVGPNGGWMIGTNRSRIKSGDLRSMPPLIRDRWDRVLSQSRILNVGGDRSIVIRDHYYDPEDVAALNRWLVENAGKQPKAA